MPGRPVFFLFQRKWYIFSISFLIYFGVVYILLCTTVWVRAWFCSRYRFFCYTFTHFIPIGVIEEKVIKISPKYFNWKSRQIYLSWLMNSIFIFSNPQGLTFGKFIFELYVSSYSFKITCIMLRYSHFHNILRIFVVLPTFPFSASETLRDYCL